MASVSFDIDYSDPFAVLGVAETSTAEEVKRAYDTLVRYTHPDKGGNLETFKKIQAAYAKIRKMTNVKDYKKLKMDFKSNKHTEEQEREAVLASLQQSGMDPKNISSSSFNAFFEKMHLRDPADRGYGEQLVPSSKEREADDRIKDVKPIKMNRVHGAEPMAILSSGDTGCYELGLEGVNNFSRLGAFTDYMEAHADNQTEAAFNEFKEKVGTQRMNFKTFEEYQKYSDEYVAKPETEAEIRNRELAEKRAAMEETIRRNRQQQRDVAIERHFNTVMNQLPAPLKK
jgi:curved DNA-binding protein CbpA